MTDRAKELSVHRLRYVARRRERLLQASLDRRALPGEQQALTAAGVPTWANGVRVDKAGLLQWVVVATENRGH